MKVSYNWLKQYIDVHLPEEELADLLTDIGLEVEGISRFESIKGGLQNIVIGHVLSTEQHPNADKLKVTKVDVGQEAPLQIVCGAPNVAAGQKVPVALVGAKIYTSDEEFFEIKKAKLRGVESIGMICAEDELGIGTNHDGIMVLKEDASVGAPLASLIPVESDVIFEIGLTPNRSDAFHHIGVARDLMAVLNFRDQSDLKLNLPDLSAFEPGNSSDLKVTVENATACPKYMGVVIENIEVKESPAWLKSRLEAIGQRPINNVVDITNFVMHEYGQPLHAFDLKAVEGEVIVKNLAEGSVFKTLDGNDIKLSTEDLMICNAKGEGMCIGGVFGGLDSGVSDSTTALFLESAYFNPKSIRRSSTRHGLRTDAAMHFEKGIDPNTTVEALKRAALLIQELAGGEITSDIFKEQAQAFPPFEVDFNYEQLNKYAGIAIEPSEVKRIFELLEIEVLEDNEASLRVAVPPYRADVQREADLIEEVLRIYGFNNIPIPEKINASIGTAKDLGLELYEKIAGYLVGNGFFEIMVNSISKEKYYENDDKIVRLLNNLNAELTIMRPEMVYSGLEPILHNINHRNKDCRFFELGKRYLVDGDGFKEEEKLSLWFTGDIAPTNWTGKAQPINQYYVKSVVENILQLAGVTSFKLKSVEDSDFTYQQTYGSKKEDYVRFGLLKRSVTEKVDVKQAVYYAEFDWAAIRKLSGFNKVQFQPLSKYPSMRRDLALLVDEAVTFKKIQGIAKQYGKQILREIDLFDTYQDKKMAANKKSYAISFIFRDDHKTLSDKEVDKVMKKLMEVYQSELNAELR